MLEVIGHDQCVVIADVHQGFSMFVNNNVGHISIVIHIAILILDAWRAYLRVKVSDKLVVFSCMTSKGPKVYRLIIGRVFLRCVHTS